MAFFTRLEMAYHLLKWKSGWDKRDIDWRPRGATSPKFLSGRQAAQLIPDGACVMVTGMAATMRPALLYWSIRDVFQQTGHPRDLTFIAAGGAGGRGRIPGTVEEVGLKGLITRFLSGHLETARSILKLGESGDCELGVLPQGTIIHLAEAQARGEDSLVSDVGVGTFVDPRTGTGSQVIPGVGEQRVEAAGDKLRYRIPKITVALLIGAAADAEGNVYMTDVPMISETMEVARAARRNGGLVLVTVARVVPKDPQNIFLPAEIVDGIVVGPRNEMCMAVRQNRPWREFLPGSKVDVNRAMNRFKVFNGLLKLDPDRGPIENALALQTAALFSHVARPGNRCIVGYGLPQEVGRLVHEGGLAKDITFLIETGIYGGTPAPGLFFGMSISPERLISSAEMFHLCEDQLDVTILGMLQADSDGNVNVSKKSPGAMNYIGPGGFINLVTGAKTIIFVGAFQARAKMVVEDGRLRIVAPGIPKFVEHVDEVTFYAKAALEHGKRVFYVTSVGTFRLTPRGLELFQVAPGIDVERDILQATPARIVLPEDGNVDILDRSVVTGEGFKLAWRA